MKKFIFALLVLFTMSIFNIDAQELRMRKYGFLENWSMSAAVGGNMTFSDEYQGIKPQNWGPEVWVSLNKDWSPVLGTRVLLGWGQNNLNLIEDWEGTKAFLQSLAVNPNRLDAGLDFTINPINLFNYNYDRRFNTLVIAGLGYSHVFEKSASNGQFTTQLNKNNYLVPKVGLQLNYRVSDPVVLFLEGDFKVYSDKLDNIVQSAQYDGNFVLTAGITYRFKNQDGTRGMNYVPSYNQEDIDMLNDKINEQRALIDSLETHPKTVVQKETIKETLTQNKINPITVSFTINSSKVEAKQQANIENIANFLKENEDVKVSIVGYADAKTGTPEYNKELSVKRAETVAEILSDKYGINKDRLTVEGLGDTVQKYQENDWNRAVIIVQE